MNTINGTVLWYDQRDGFGIVQDEQGTEYYIDKSVLHCDSDILQGGVFVRFKLNEEITSCICAKDVITLLLEDEVRAIHKERVKRAQEKFLQEHPELKREDVFITE